PARAAAQFDLARHLAPLLAAQVGQFLAAQPRRLFRRAQLAQAVERRLDHVVRVPRALRLGEDVADAHRLEHRAHAAARDAAGSFAGRLEQPLARAEVTHRLVRNGGARERDLEQVLLRLLAAFADRFRHFVRLAQPGADVALAVADDDERGEREAPAALHDLGDAVDVD